MTKTWCVGGRQYTNTKNITEYEKVNPKTKNLLKTFRELVVFVVVKNYKFSLSK